MGKLKDRQMITTVADLLIWRQVINGYVVGTVHDSRHEAFPDGKRSTWQFYQIIHYPALTGHWEEHLLLQWWDGTFLKAEHKNMEQLIDRTKLL
jgi:hypothetical protein